MSGTNTSKTRPLSPHLQVYKLPITAKMSILHRACGFALSVGTVMVVWLLVAAASGPDAYAIFKGFADSALGKLMLFGWTVAMFYHMSNGVRHLFWDTGRLFKIEDAFKAGYLVLASTVILTVLTWWAVCPWSDK